MSQEKEIQILLKSNGINLSDFHTVETLTDAYIDYTTDIEIKKIKTGFPKLDNHIRGLRTQELLTVVAGTGIGKSALALNFLLNYARTTKELTVLFSLEMSSVGIAERIFQVELDKFGYEIEDSFIKQDGKFIESCKNLKSSLNNFVIITKRIEVHQIPAYVKIIELLKGKKVRLIGVDYVGIMENKTFPKDEYLRVTDNMKLLYSFAKILDLAVINLSQVSRLDIKPGNNNGKLNLYSGKGSGEVENSSDFFITLERLDSVDGKDGIESEMFLTIQDYNSQFREHRFDLILLSIHKNRRGKTGKIYAVFDRKNLRIKEYNETDFNNYRPSGITGGKDIIL